MITYIKFIKISLLLFCAIIIIIGFSASQNTNSDFSSSHIAQAQQKPKADAIGVRVLPNPEHYDPLTWYRQQGFKGDPEKLRVDGYRAVREGRSVYINAANIEDNNLKTYIYIISFNQEIGPETIEIFNRIISNWEFNTNISQEMGKCEISALFCDNDDSCPENYICSENKCLPSEGDIPNCRIDSDCPQGLFCNSPKARIVRDVKRLADIGKIKTRLEKYYNQKGKYPVLSSGSYVKYKTLSAWPSWQKELGKRLGIKLPQDPVNALGDCGDPRFQPRTCWDKQVLEFAGDLNSTPIDLPAGSKTYFYNTTDPHNYKLCGLTETGYKNLEGISCSEKFTVNNPPVINCSNLRGSQGHPFSRHVEAVDPEGDNIENWTIESVDPAWSDDGGEYITISKSGSNQALLKADQAPAQRNSYNITLSTTDSFGAETSKTCTIEISDLSPEISANCPSEVRINNEYGGCRIEYSDPESGRSEASFFYSWKNDNKPDGLETKKDTGKITGTPTESGNYSVTVWTQDEGGLESNKINLDLAVNTYCGDGEVQNLNMEGTGGPNDRGYEQCEDDGEGTAEDDQYECNNCAWTGGWCGDDTVQDGTGDTNDHEEECEGPGEGTSRYDQYDCTSNCTWTDAWCGDGVVQDGTDGTVDYGEECEGPGEGTSRYDQYDCTSNCTWTNAWCGDGVVQDGTDGTVDYGEVCDGPGGGTSVNDQYECASDCQSWQGGWCGNGSIDNYEDCDISESIDKKRETLRGEGVPNVSSMSDRHVEILYDSTCIFCSFDVQDWGDVGLGCYVDDSCEKGKFLRWNPETEEWECVPFDPPLYDYCCVNNNNPEKSGTSLHDLAYDVIYPSISDPDNNNFKCDEICQDYGKVCIGVGLMDSDTNYCKSVKHHEPPLITC